MVVVGVGAARWQLGGAGAGPMTPEEAKVVAAGRGVVGLGRKKKNGGEGR